MDPSLDGYVRAVTLTPRAWRRFRERGGDPARLRNYGAAALRRLLGIGANEAARMARRLTRIDPWRIAEEAERAGVALIPCHDGAYPDALRQLDDAPPLFFLRGKLVSGPAGGAVAFAGSRRATSYGVRVARTLAGDLARAGVVVVAGLARGIDAAVHEGVLAAGGVSVAVLCSGLLNPYPPEHADLLERIVARGAGLSELPLDAAPSPARHRRLVAALGTALVVVEAAVRGGALDTARHALDLGRTVMAVPGPVDAPLSRATLRMLQDGAAPVGSAADIFAALGWCDRAPSELPAGERAALEALPEDGATAADLARHARIPEEAAAGYLVTLELRGLVERANGKYHPR